MQYRALGRTGLTPSCVALSSLSLVEIGPDESDRFIHDAVARGVTYFDVAPTYANGEAERRFGRVLPALRDKVILACKTEQRTADAARRALDQSLARLRTDHVDIYQLHSLDTDEELDTALGPGGAVEAIQKAVESGKARFIGITGHNHALLVRAVERFPFATVLTPVNYVLRDRCLPALKTFAARGVGVIAIKATAHRPWRADETKESAARRAFPYCWYRPLAEPDAVARSVGWTLAQPVATAVPGASPLVARLVLEAAEKGFPAPDAAALDALGLEPTFDDRSAALFPRRDDKQ